MAASEGAVVQIQGISSALFAPAAEPATTKLPVETEQAHQAVAQTNVQAASAAVPAHSTVTIYNAKGQANQVGAVPSAPHK